MRTGAHRSSTGAGRGEVEARAQGAVRPCVRRAGGGGHLLGAGGLEAQRQPRLAGGLGDAHPCPPDHHRPGELGHQPRPARADAPDAQRLDRVGPAHGVGIRALPLDLAKIHHQPGRIGEREGAPWHALAQLERQLGAATPVLKRATLEQRTEALKQVIWIFTGVTVVGGVVVWMCVPGESGPVRVGGDNALSLSNIGTVLKNPAVWLQGMIVVTAYTGYKGMDDLGLFARDVFAFDDVRAANVSAVAFWVRPFAALGAGIISDKVGGPRAIAACFVLMILGDAFVALGLLDPTAPWMLFTSVVSISAAVFGLRGIYFAIFDDAGVPAALTGTAAGLVSVIGYTPDIFMGPINGYLTDTYPGSLGHQYFFGVLAGFAVLGLCCTLAFQRLSAQRSA